MVLQNYQNFTEMTSNMIYIVAFVVGLKCPRKVHLNTQWEGSKMSVSVHAQGIKNCPRKGGGGQKMAKFCSRSC